MAVTFYQRAEIFGGAIGSKTKIVEIPANPTAGTAVALTGTLQDLGVNVSNLRALYFTNGATSGSAYFRTSKGLGATPNGRGIQLFAGATLTLGWIEDPDQTLLLENATPVYCMVLY